MQKYFISNLEFEECKITSSDVFHIKNVMRCSVGDMFIVSNQVEQYLCKISKIEKDYVCFDKIEALNNFSEFPFFVDIYQGYPKGDKLEDVIKHSSELGVSKIYPVIMKRSIFKLDDKKKDSKLQRFNKIAKEAAELSNRMVIPSIVDIKKLNEYDFSTYDIKILCYEEESKDSLNFKKCIKNIKPNDKVCILIGPEGGVDSTEIDYLDKQGFIICSLGPRILRTQTASLYVLSAISYEWELK